VSTPIEPARPARNALLNFIERAGNRMPHPAILFLGLIAGVIVLSHLLALAGVAVTYQRVDPATHRVETASAAVVSLLAPAGVRYMFTSVVANFVQFGPVGIIIVAMIGVGLAEQSGLIGALIRKIVLVAPGKAVTAIIVTLGVVSSLAADAGYLVLIPLGATAFYSLGRHPLAGLAAAFAGVAATFGANFLVKPIDSILADMTNDAIHIVEPERSIDLAANFFFGIASSVLLVAVCTAVSAWIVEPRLGRYRGVAPVDAGGRLSASESRGLLFALAALGAFVGLLLWLTVPAGAALRNPETGALLGRSPFMDSLVFLIMAVFLLTGLAYGRGAGTIPSAQAAVDAVVKTIAGLADLLVLLFVIAQFVAYFNYSNMGTVLAVQLAGVLKDLNLGPTTLLLTFIGFGLLMSFPVPNILPKWAIMAPVFVPLFLKLGIAPEAVLAAYRVSDAPPNVINPLLPHFALVVGFTRRWQPDAGVGTVAALMIPYFLATAVAWTALFLAWYWLGLPFGPG